MCVQEDDLMIKQALIVGNFAAAVKRCIDTGRMADAIIYSSCGGPKLWEETRAAYFNQHPQPFVRYCCW